VTTSPPRASLTEMASRITRPSSREGSGMSFHRGHVDGVVGQDDALDHFVVAGQLYLGNGHAAIS
jgi:hypothetical protein